MNPEIQFIQKQIEDLQKKVDNLSNSTTIDRNIETAFTERLNTVAVAGTSTASTQNIVVSATPATITVPAQPSGTLTVTYKGTTYNLLYK